jgi:hypothetical protein
MKKLNLDNLSREDARKLVMGLPRKKAFVTDVLKDGTKIYFTTDGEKESKKDGRPLKGHYDIKVHFEGEPKRKFSYINDIFVDLIKNEQTLGDTGVNVLLTAVKDSIELTPLEGVYKRYPELNDLEGKKSGYSIEFLLAILKILALQEDINYWGMNPKTKKRYEGREKPYNALYDLLVKKMPLTHVTRKHKLY